MSDAGPSTAQRAYEHVKAQLLDGRFRDGELLSEGAVADAVGISRTPVREAFLRLASEGLLELYPKRGALVVPVSAVDAVELFETRVLVESHCIRTALGLDAAGLGEAARAALEEGRVLAGSGDRAGFIAADRALHRTWVAAAGNRVLLTLFDQLRDRQQRVAASIIASGRRAPAQLVAEHEEIVLALCANDADAAVEALRAHLGAARHALA
jgi:DNA-binding GntR family transcriptional regulator